MSSNHPDPDIVGNWSKLFEHFPDTIFFLKDRDCRFIEANGNLLARFGLASESDLVGRSELDFVPFQIANDSMADDRLVIENNRPILNRIEPFPTAVGIFEWCSTIKYPHINETGEVVGVIGVSRPMENSGGFSLDSRMTRAVKWLDDNLAEFTGVEEIADALDISSRHLQRVFQSEVGYPVSEFVSRTRVFKAAELLRNSSESVGDIAILVGFCDQSALSRNFRKFLGCTALEWRQKV